ncbi:hypothetical protein [Planotetraspora sp. GP83]|uniref:hypothetical protein n=1 Tax=Planotetraspora sp. GP83 TaxID=3156264 RepID=UPI0035153D86
MVRTAARAERVEHDGDGFRIGLADGVLQAERLLVAAGRRTNLADLGLEHPGLDPRARVLDADERMRVAEGLWAIGGKGAFTHMSMYQANVVIRDLTGADGPWADYRAVARVTFIAPEVGSVGLSEAAARERGVNVRTATGDLGPAAGSPGRAARSSWSRTPTEGHWWAAPWSAARAVRCSPRW